jgi:hypothetical protein
VEQFVLCDGDLEVSKKMQAEMIQTAEEFYQSLGIAYRVINIVSGGSVSRPVSHPPREEALWLLGECAPSFTIACDR